MGMELKERKVLSKRTVSKTFPTWRMWRWKAPQWKGSGRENEKREKRIEGKED